MPTTKVGICMVSCTVLTAAIAFASSQAVELPPVFTPGAHWVVPQVGIPSVGSRMNLGKPSSRACRYAAAALTAAVVGVELPAEVAPMAPMMAAALLAAG